MADLVLLQELQLDGDVVAHPLVLLAVDLELQLGELDLGRGGGVPGPQVQLLQIGLFTGDDNTPLPVYPIRLTTRRQTARTHVQFWGLEAEVGEGVAQLPLRLHDLGQLRRQSLSQPDHVLVLSLIVAEDFDLSLQLHVHGPRAPAQLLRQDLPGTLQRTVF
ncbi:hypothetical protein EYF80_000342 [Liparis tanakae]|uniref:Uncharacterized protein n=1 Tax=Liparis tanakae TaxID=230148 RepID=A0A4Z2JHE7_9TELE|nr:hypothetical protein EYF80_000342 [Liparis tanakae]